MSAKAGEVCDMKHDVLLVEDTSSDSSYLQCLPAGRGFVFLLSLSTEFFHVF